MQEDTVGPDSVLRFKILWSSPCFILLFEFGREGSLISVWVHILWSGQSLKPPLRIVLVRSCEVGGRSSTLLVILSGECADGCCPRLDTYNIKDDFLFQAIWPNKFCIAIKDQVWVVFLNLLLSWPLWLESVKYPPNFAHCNDTAPYCRRFWSASILPNGLGEATNKHFTAFIFWGGRAAKDSVVFFCWKKSFFEQEIIESMKGRGSYLSFL